MRFIGFFLKFDFDLIMWHNSVNFYRLEQTQGNNAVTKTFSTFNTGNFNPTESMSRQKTGLIEFEAPLPQPSQTSGMTPSYVQRANTFIAQHRLVTNQALFNTGEVYLGALFLTCLK